MTRESGDNGTTQGLTPFACDVVLTADRGQDAVPVGSDSRIENRGSDSGRSRRPEVSPSCGTFEVAEIMGCSDAHAADTGTSTPDPDTLAAATREDRPPEYRRKHVLELST